MTRLRLLTTPGAAVLAASAPAAQPPSTTAAAGWSRPVFVAGYALAIVGLIAGAAITFVYQPAAFTPGDGFAALALFYIAAQALERLVEPFTGLLKAKPADTQSDTSGDDGETTAGRAVSKRQALAMVNRYLAEAYQAHQAQNTTLVQQQLNLAAAWQGVVDAMRQQLSVLVFGVTVLIGSLLAAILGLYLMRAVGATAVPLWLDVMVTGLVISGGSKGLHDLIKNIEKAKENKENPPEANA